jgi:hypothetical protein
MGWDLDRMKGEKGEHQHQYLHSLSLLSGCHDLNYFALPSLPYDDRMTPMKP